ncbi:LppX_LprAFG lipoprotein [Streptomyces poriferorum]|uniref:LppX_LprAFG lipoprotein n=1 Tax=Streptomyces poriferorum TaxID=2798799 RepID=A0ABY9IP42_9ACTN|nr:MULTISPECIES: LppX_LprAFG lipoprotein [unclassified Streptomyces]MDP5314027.1 LppX_LprAFG lipoprotein [Streptomyces sp. Alt4]WLQ57036.1 LppX_LprAFG lipoprotein [Streptomyces sp. Alt2]
MRTSTVRRVGLAVAVAAALTSVGACGGSEDGSTSKARGKDAGSGVVKTDAIAALLDVQKKTGAASSAKVEGTMTVGSAMSMKQSGALDWSDGVSGSMEITYTGGAMADTMKKSGGNGTMQARYFKDGYAADMGEAMAQQTGGKRWISYSYEDLAALGGASGAAMKDQMQNTTPDQGVKSLLASGDVKEVGKEQVRGVRTTHYSGTVDVAELTAKTSKLDADQLAALKKQLNDAGITTETVDIWVDENDLLVKKSERGQMKTGELNTTMFYSDYGTKVSVQRPPAGETIGFKELFQQQQGATAGAS